MPVVKVEDLASGPIRILVYGPTGAGKTYFCGTALEVDELCPILYVDFEAGIASIRHMLLRHRDRAAILHVSNMKDIDVVSSASLGKTKAKTIILDSLSEMHAFLLSDVMTRAGRPNGPPQQQDFGDVHNAMLMFMRRAKEANAVNLICTAGEAVTENEMTGLLRIQPDVVGKLAWRLPRFFDILGYLDTQGRKRGKTVEIIRTLQTQPFNRIRAKSRISLDVIPPVLLDPTMQRVYDGFREGDDIVPRTDENTINEPEPTEKTELTTNETEETNDA